MCWPSTRGRVAARFEVAIAGVAGVIGSSMHPDSRNEMAPWGVDGPAADRFTAQQLQPEMVTGGDLVLCASTRHRADVVQLSPRALPMSFSLREFARLAASVDPARLPEEPVERSRSLVGLARGRRGMLPAVGPDDDQVPDPIGRGAEAHRQSAMLIQEALATIVGVIVPHQP